MYNIWLQDMKTGIAKPWSTNLTIAKAYSAVSLKQEGLKPNQQLLVEEVKTGRVDMLFTKKSTITPQMPMSINSRTGKVITMSPRPQSVRSKQNTRMTRSPNYRAISTKGFWRMKSTDLRSWLSNKNNGTPKTRRFASFVLSTRRPKR